jgi:predicted O-methyltransferase YrrM
MSTDYVSSNLYAPQVDHLFPQMIEADKSVTTWSYLRRSIDHIFRVDRREPIVGFISRDEAAVLYGNAHLFSGRKAIEVGAWRGWSTVHLLAAGVGSLHVVDPLLADAAWRREFAATLEAAGGAGRAELVAEKSPEAIARLGEAGVRWSFAFIDGDHDGEAPRLDALACEPFLEATAMVVFHDLVSPHVAAGLLALGQRGWRIAAYQTAQMMGVAWRGETSPVAHRPDPAQPWDTPAHLAGVEIIGLGRTGA